MCGGTCGVGEMAELTTAIGGRENIRPAVSQQEDPTNLGCFDDDALPRTRKGSGSGTSRSVCVGGTCIQDPPKRVGV